MHDDRLVDLLAKFPFPIAVGVVFSTGFLLFVDYNPIALGALVALFFAVYIWLRVMIFLENDRFTPKRRRVGLSWALVGVYDEADEFDPRPVRVYFVLLFILFIGMVIRPILGWFQL